MLGLWNCVLDDVFRYKEYRALSFNEAVELMYQVNLDQFDSGIPLLFQPLFFNPLHLHQLPPLLFILYFNRLCRIFDSLP